MTDKGSSILVISNDSYFNTSLANECYINNIDVIFKNGSLESFLDSNNTFTSLVIIDFHIKNFNNIVKTLDSKIILHNTIIVFNDNEGMKLYRRSNSNTFQSTIRKI